MHRLCPRGGAAHYTGVTDSFGDTGDGKTCVTCYLLHIMEDPDRDAYRDADLKDVVGLMPRFFCAQCDPLRPLVASEAVKCMRRNAPCWKAPGTICPEPPADQASGPSSPDGSGAPDTGPFTF